MDIYEQITKMADEIAPELVAQRRDFHKFAEKGWFEMRTSSIIARKLTEMGYEDVYKRQPGIRSGDQDLIPLPGRSLIL